MQSKRSPASASSASSLEPTAVTSTSSPAPTSSTTLRALHLVVLDDEQPPHAGARGTSSPRVNVARELVGLDGPLEEAGRAGAQRREALLGARRST